jgi:hypothetical protein
VSLRAQRSNLPVRGHEQDRFCGAVVRRDIGSHKNQQESADARGKWFTIDIHCHVTSLKAAAIAGAYLVR